MLLSMRRSKMPVRIKNTPHWRKSTMFQITIFCCLPTGVAYLLHFMVVPLCMLIQQPFPLFLVVGGRSCVGWQLFGHSAAATAHPPGSHHQDGNHLFDGWCCHTPPPACGLISWCCPMRSNNFSGCYAHGSSACSSVDTGVMTCLMTMPPSGDSSMVPPSSSIVSGTSPSSVSWLRS